MRSCHLNFSIVE